MTPTRCLPTAITILLATVGVVTASGAIAACLSPEIPNYINKSIALYQGEKPLQQIPLHVRVWDRQADIDSLADQLQRLSAADQAVWFVASIGSVDDVRTVEGEFRNVDRGAYLVIDSAFMSGGLPKYNNILETYKDVALDELDLKLMFDPYLDVVDSKAIFAQLVPGHNTTNLAYKIESAAILMRFPGLLAAESFTKYLGELSDELEIDKDHEQVVARCIEDTLALRASQE